MQTQWPNPFVARPNWTDWLPTTSAGTAAQVIINPLNYLKEPNLIVPKTDYHVTVKFSPEKNRKVAHFRTTTGEPHIDIQFPLPDRYADINFLVGNDEELLALAFSQIVQTALRSIAEQQRLQQQALSVPQGKTEQVLAGETPEVTE